ncbi:uncharacterized protein IWZ02DRAFT_430690 [Phyllosticta citriasiana]|uniref:Uncharacterized protein n=1 Tax=Phyllosticta citriasiana TaxID=595635 RepID=A0ABR1KH77_9PEZI
MYVDLHTTTTGMPSSSVTPQLCYFSYVPSSASDCSSHYSSETPSPGPNYDILSPNTPSEPSNPLLAARNPLPVSFSNNMSTVESSSSKVLQLQTAAAYRPQPQPVQDVLDLSPIDTRAPSTNSASSSSSSSARGSVSSASTPVLHFVRCSRCHRSGSQGSKDMVGWGMNSYYCTRCADMVGYQHG